MGCAVETAGCREKLAMANFDVSSGCATSGSSARQSSAPLSEAPVVPVLQSGPRRREPREPLGVGYSFGKLAVANFNEARRFDEGPHRLGARAYARVPARVWLLVRICGPRDARLTTAVGLHKSWPWPTLMEVSRAKCRSRETTGGRGGVVEGRIALERKPRLRSVRRSGRRES